MAGVNTFDTYKSVGIREDLLDVIEDISPTDTPFCSNVGSGSSKGTYHEWQKDSLAAPSDTPVAEGADAVPAALTPTIRLGNYTQINEKSYIISGSDLKADNAGRGVEMAYQEAKKGLEIRKDVEFAMVGTNKARNAGAGNDPGAAAARESASVLSWIATNTSSAAGDGVADTNAPLGDGTDTRQRVVEVHAPRPQRILDGGMLVDQHNAGDDEYESDAGDEECTPRPPHHGTS